jgi:NAD(P)-dependent dehydrogenase (short-subunit alcohol dehydrogenase family)
VYNLTDKVALVTGGAQGIGKGIAKLLLEEGMRVVIADMDQEAGAETAEELQPIGEVRFILTDVGDENSVLQAMQTIVGGFGRLDGLINNAGIANPVNRAAEELPLAEWERVVRTNLTGCFLCAKHAVPHLRTQGGCIVNIASTRALQSEPHTEAYAASKGGILALTHALAVSLGPDIRVNCISPGWIDVSGWKKKSIREQPKLRPINHQQRPVGRAGHPQDVASLVAFLISDGAGFITGQNFVIDGGMTRKMIYAE